MIDETEIDVQAVGIALDVLRTEEGKLRRLSRAVEVLTGVMPQIGLLASLTARIAATGPKADEAERLTEERIVAAEGRAGAAETAAAARVQAATERAERADVYTADAERHLAEIRDQVRVAEERREELRRQLA